MEQEISLRTKGVHVSSSKELPRKDYESLDYDVCYNRPFSEMLKSKSSLSLRGHNLMRWVVTFIIGVLTGLVAVFIDYFITLLSKWKFSVLDNCPALTKCTPEGCLAVSLLVLLLFNLSFTSIAGILTALEPVAAGSGIPEIKCYLNGIKVPRVVRLKTLICKAVGVLFSVAGGLFVGKEGPMIHSGAIIGAGVPQFQSIAFRKIKFNFPYFRTDRDKRDFVSGGAAAGVAAAFGAPIGGVLFSLEEGSSFWNQALTWRSFFCSMASTFTLNFFLSGITGSGWGSFYQPGLLNFGVFKCDPNQGKSCDLWTIRDLLIFIAMGFVGGLLGAWFNALNKHLTVYRILHVQKRHKVVRVLEAILVALGTTCLAFFCPIYLGHCKALPKDVSEELLNNTKQYFCDDGQYNDMATLFFNNQESAIRQLFHWDDGFSLISLWIFFICFYFLACWTYGASIPSGLFVPCLLCGASYGRFVGALLRKIGYAKTYHGTFALIGAASFLGGVVRMTISLTVILIESTNEISYGLPLMITLMVAKFSGDLFNEGLYDIHIKLKRVPLLEWAAPEKFYKLRASDIMESCLSYIYPHTRVHSIVGILKTTAHNAFPVVTVDKGQPEPSSDADYDGNPASANERYARKTTVSALTSEQKTRGSSLVLDGDEEHGQGASTGYRRPNALDEMLYSSSAPLFSPISGTASSEASHRSGFVLDHPAQRICEEQPGPPVRQTSRTYSMAEAEQTQTLTFHGIVLRSQLVTLLKKRIFYPQNQGQEIQVVDFAGMTEDYPRFPDIHDLHYSSSDDDKIMDVTPYMNQCPYMISPSAPVPLVFNLFRTMGLRHLVVVNKKGQLVGMITRFNLTEEYMELCLEKLEAHAVEE